MAQYSNKKSPADPRSRSSSPEPKAKSGGMTDQLRGCSSIEEQLALLAPPEEGGEKKKEKPEGEATSIDACRGVAQGLADAQTHAEKGAPEDFSKCHYTASTLIALLSEDPAQPVPVDAGTTRLQYGSTVNADGLGKTLTQNASDDRPHAYRVRLDAAPGCGGIGMHSWVVLQQGQRLQHLQSDMDNYQLGQWMKTTALANPVAEAAHAALGQEVALGTYLGMLATAVKTNRFAPLTGIASMGTADAPLSEWELHWDEWRLPAKMPSVAPERLARAAEVGTTPGGSVGYMTTYSTQ